MKSNPPHESLGKTSIKIIRVMQNIGMTTSPERTTSSPEKLRETIDPHDLPTIWSWVSNGFFRSIL